MFILVSINWILITIARSFKVAETHDRLKKEPVWDFKSIIEVIFNIKLSGDLKSITRGVLCYGGVYVGSIFNMEVPWDVEVSWDGDTSWNTDSLSELNTTRESLNTTTESYVSAKSEIGALGGESLYDGQLKEIESEIVLRPLPINVENINVEKVFLNEVIRDDIGWQLPLEHLNLNPIETDVHNLVESESLLNSDSKPVPSTSNTPVPNEDSSNSIMTNIRRVRRGWNDGCSIQ